MEADFWHKKWEINEIGFHITEANPLLVKYFPALDLKKTNRVFVPLCGKTLDIGWLLSNGYRVVGAELSKTAIEQLFQGLGIEPIISMIDSITHYSGDNIDIFVGDVFLLTKDLLGPVDAIYDRAALVALPELMRERYTAHLATITNNAQQLLISFDYDQNAMAGPPFSISNEEIKRHYDSIYHVNQLGSHDVAGGLKGICKANENVWLLKQK